MKKSLSILLFAVLASGCMKRENLYDEERAAEEEAKKNFPVQNIDPEQDWNMGTSRSLNVSVNEKTGETYTIKVYDGYPFAAGGACLLAKEVVKDGGMKTIKFDAPAILKRVYVMRRLTSTDYYVKAADLRDGQFEVIFGESLSGAAGARSVAKAMAFSPRYREFPTGAEEVEEQDLKNLNKAGNYVIRTEVTVDEGVKIGNDVHLYIAEGGALVMTGTGGLRIDGKNSSVSVLEGRLEIPRADLEMNGSNGNNENPQFYCGEEGIVSVEDVDLKACVWMNDGMFTALTDDGFEMGHGVQLQNNCRLEIKSKKGGKDDILRTAADKGAAYSVFNNQGYVVVDGDASWENIYVNLAGEGVFHIKGELDLEDNVTFSVIGANTLIKAGEMDWNEEVTVSEGSSSLRVACGNIGDEDNLPDHVEIVNPFLIDEGECTVAHGNAEEDDKDKLAVATFGFEDIIGGTTDYDFNDVVLHVTNVIDNKIKVILVAAGATNAITVQYSLDNGAGYTDLLFNGEQEVHAAFGVPVTQMKNTDRPVIDTDAGFPSCMIPVSDNDFSFAANGRIRIHVTNEEGKSHLVESHTAAGGVPYALCVPVAWSYPVEHQRIDAKFPQFEEWGQGIGSEDWYKTEL